MLCRMCGTAACLCTTPDQWAHIVVYVTGNPFMHAIMLVIHPTADSNNRSACKESWTQGETKAELSHPGRAD